MCVNVQRACSAYAKYIQAIYSLLLLEQDEQVTFRNNITLEKKSLTNKRPLCCQALKRIFIISLKNA